MKLFSSLYNKVLNWARHPNAPRYLGILSFAESSFFPIPPDVMLIPMVMAKPSTWRWLALLTTITSVLGGVTGYFIGYFSFETLEPLIIQWGYGAKIELAKTWFMDWGIWVVLAAGFSPIPYKVFTIASGVTNLDLTTFIVSSAVSRSARFFLVAALLWKYGSPIREFIENHLAKLTLLFCILLVGMFVMLKYI